VKPRGGAAAPSRRSFHTLTLLPPCGDDDAAAGAATLLLFGGTDSLRGGDSARKVFLCDTLELRAATASASGACRACAAPRRALCRAVCSLM
jgi:hypothetical protein